MSISCVVACITVHLCQWEAGKLIIPVPNFQESLQEVPHYVEQSSAGIRSGPG